MGGSHASEGPLMLLAHGKLPTVLQEIGHIVCSQLPMNLWSNMLLQNVIPFWKELFVDFKMAPNIKSHSLCVWGYRRLYKSHSCILKYF